MCPFHIPNRDDIKLIIRDVADKFAVLFLSKLPQVS